MQPVLEAEHADVRAQRHLANAELRGRRGFLMVVRRGREAGEGGGRVYTGARGARPTGRGSRCWKVELVLDDVGEVLLDVRKSA